ncbi:hypothetical protein ACFQT0_16505 [Hymenobacter humi]|uniref:Phosphate starvation-inducible protein PsiF n=1 Tax=Hymenobacter humi TaxID=1411620 RepID=A0ABW2U5R8_9BACT
MKNTLLALALFAFAGTTAFAHDGHDKPSKKGKKAACTTEMKATCTKDMKGSMAGGSCCMKAGKTAAVKPVAAPTTKSL